MVREIKTTLAVDGEKAFAAALRDAQREMSVMNADLKAMAAEYRATDDAQKYFADKSETLGRKIKQQEEIVEALAKAVKDAAEKYGDAGAKTDSYRIKLSNATAKLFDMRREAETTAKELEDLGRDSEKVGRQLERGIGEAAEEVEEQLDGMFAKMTGDMETLKNNAVFQTTMDVGGFVIDGINSIMDFVNENTELNRMLSVAKHNIEAYDFNWEEVRGLIVRASAITGNQEDALEAVSNLAAAGFDSEELMYSAMDALLGAYLKTGGSLSLASLAEDFRASVVSGAPTGTYAEVIEEVLQGVLVDDVKKALEDADTMEERLEIALGVLTKGGLQTKTKSYEEANAELIEQQVKQQELALKWAELAEQASPIVTKYTELMMWVADQLTSMVSNVASNIEQLEAIFANPSETILNTEWNRENARQEQPEFMEALDSGQLDTFGGTLKYFWENLFPGAGAEAATTEGEETANNFLDGFISKAMESEYAEAYLNALGIDYAPVLTDAETAGKNVSVNLANGISLQASTVIQAVSDIVDAINAQWSRIGSPSLGIGGIGGAGATLNIDGQTAGRLLYDGISEAGGRAVMTKMLVE